MVIERKIEKKNQISIDNKNNIGKTNYLKDENW